MAENQGESAGPRIDDGEFQAGANRDRAGAAPAVEPGVAINVLRDSDASSD